VSVMARVSSTRTGAKQSSGPTRCHVPGPARASTLARPSESRWPPCASALRARVPHVSTLLNSGNAVFRLPRGTLPARLACDDLGSDFEQAQGRSPGHREIRRGPCERRRPRIRSHPHQRIIRACSLHSPRMRKGCRVSRSLPNS
jgi:hypothetical protein